MIPWRMPEPCMCGALDCPACRGPASRCATCALDEACPHGHDLRACARERQEDEAAYRREAWVEAQYERALERELDRAEAAWEARRGRCGP